MDSIVHTAAQVAAAGRTNDPLLSVYLDVAGRLAGAPRFLFDSAATRTWVELSLGRPKVLREAMAHLAVPYPKLWVEWADADRQALRDKFDEPLSYPELRPMPVRVGFLLEVEPGGRRGHATWAWTSPTSIGEVKFPNVGPVEPFFDLDQTHRLPERLLEGLLKGNLFKLWAGNPVQQAALHDIWSTSQHGLSPWGAECFRRMTPLQQSLALADTLGEYITIWAIMMLLTASRPIVDLVPIDIGRLNKRRRQRGETALLDYTQVTLRLAPPDDPQYNPVLRGPLGHSRKSPRVHLVSSYLARRGPLHWVVQPYLRGKGEVIHRRVNVKG